MKTSNLYVRIEPELKQEAETILSKLGLSLSSAINLFFKQIVIQNGLPFDLKVPLEAPKPYEYMTEEELRNEISAGIKDIKDGRTMPAKQFFEEFDKKYKIWAMNMKS